ncbi:MAG: Maf family protein [Bacteriovoracaceae bacterium]|nr:Maf family protein [Bacteriovoracaceae bacterium]
MQDNNKWQLILASASPRRKELLGYTKLNFQIITKSIDEVSHQTDPRLFALDVAKKKGEAVAQGLIPSRQVVISADTVVALHGKLFGKPSDENEARRFLLELSGKVHEVHTAVVLHVYFKHKWHAIEHVETTHVEFLKIDPRLLEDYLASGDSLDKAGGYGIQGQAQTFIKSLNGSYSNVVGFPLSVFCEMMASQFIHLIEEKGPWQNLF